MSSSVPICPSSFLGLPLSTHVLSFSLPLLASSPDVSLCSICLTVCRKEAACPVNASPKQRPFYQKLRFSVQHLLRNWLLGKMTEVGLQLAPVAPETSWDDHSPDQHLDNNMITEPEPEPLGLVLDLWKPKACAYCLQVLIWSNSLPNRWVTYMYIMVMLKRSWMSGYTERTLQAFPILTTERRVEIPLKNAK